VAKAATMLVDGMRNPNTRIKRNKADFCFKAISSMKCE
jgi:hypothetical protein